MSVDVDKLCWGVAIHVERIIDGLSVTGKARIEHKEYAGTCDWATWIKFIEKSRAYGITVNVDKDGITFSL